MGLLNKKKKRDEQEVKLPPLPELPELPRMDEGLDNSREIIHQLPSFPTNSLGEKFSQNTIKKAVTGKEEGDEIFADDFAEEEMQMMQKPLIEPWRREIPIGFEEAAKRVKRIEPIFIRIDKFEESLHIFDKTKKQISEIETMLRYIRKTKEQ